MEDSKAKILSFKEGAAKRGTPSSHGEGTNAKRGGSDAVPKAQKHHFDFALFIALVLICAFGLVMLFSASYYYAQSKTGDGLVYVKKQIVFFAAGIVALLVLSHIKYTAYQKLALIAYLVLVALLVLTLLIGKSPTNGAQRWIKIGPLEFQPSELAKFVMVIVAANFMTVRKARMGSFLHGILPMLIYMVIPCFLIYKQPNLSMVVIVAITMFLMLYLGGAKSWQLALLVVVGIAAVYLLSKSADYRSDRLEMWSDPWKDPTGKGYQIIQSLYAFGNGGLFGQGINYSRQKLLFLPYRESDYILSIIGEELGFFGCLFLIALYMFVIYRGIRIAMRCRDRFGSLTAAGITGVLAIQVIVNIAVVTNTLPSTGQTLPLVSSGGTSMMVFLAAMGILLNISRYTEVRSK